MNNIFKCPKCKKAFSLPSCDCGYTASCNNKIYQLTSDPYMVKDDSADVKYIGYEDIGEAYSGGAAFAAMTVDEKFSRIAKIIGDGILLDLACGDGLYTVPLLRCGVKIIAMDISDKMLSLLYKRAKNANADISSLIVCRANALDIPLADGSVDSVIANSMLHLISKPEIVVNEIYRVLKKGGNYITFEDKPTTSEINKNKILSEEEQAENKRHEEMAGFVHHRYFQILKDEYNILGTRYSWGFDREKVCDDLFGSKEAISIPINNKMQYTFKDSFLCRMGGKGYSDQSDVPLDIHKIVFERTMVEFTEKYGDSALNTVYTGFENDVEVTVYKK
ncbi:MAG: class I SAM-dependent methyltransferase [Oscillospiraceae bacterium]|nr:class I SAM-dependent methyltransferase [Oscillospiraceae bacterium]